MNKWIVLGAAALLVFAGVIYFAREPQETAAGATASAEKNAAAEAAKPVAAASVPASRSTPPARPKPADPRLAALMVSPANALIEFVPDSSGRVIKEIDNDPNSLGYRKPLREYTYAGDQVIRLVSYKYLGDQIQIVTADVRYKADGSVDSYREATNYENGKTR